MDFDENDIVSTNKYISMNEYNETHDDGKIEFQNYYRKEIENADNEYRKSKSKLRSEFTSEDENFIEIAPVSKGTSSSKRQIQEIKTLVSIDSRDRDTTIYHKPNNFKIFLGNVFYNVKSVSLVSIEFPNTNAVINSSNNNLYWINKEDIDDDIVDNITKTYPVYSVNLRTGSYIASTLQTELSSKLSSVKRRNKTGDFHYFDVSLDLDTDIVTFISLILTQLPNNPFSVSVGTGIITVNAPSHGYSSGDTVYIVGAKTISGIQSTTLNTSHSITVINTSSFQFEVNVKAGETSVGGGNTVKHGREAPFQFLFGEYKKTIADNIGFPAENSSQRINTYIKSINNIYQVKIISKTHTNFLNTYDYIGKTCNISFGITTPDIGGNKVISTIIDSNTFLIIVNAPIDFSVYNSGTFEFESNVFEIDTISNYNINTVVVETFDNHNYYPSDIGTTISLKNTNTIPSLDNDSVIYSVISDTQFFIPGSLLNGGDLNNTVLSDTVIPFHNPFSTTTIYISNIEIGNITTITCENHGLSSGDRIKFFNTVTSPSILDFNSSVHEIYTVISQDQFTINFKTVSYEYTNIENQTAYISTNKIKTTFPHHGFNSIVSITSISELSFNAEITTLLPHGKQTGDSIRISNTDNNIDGNYEIEIVDSDTFKIFVPGGILNNGTYGIIGMSNSFYIYGSDSIANIEEQSINSIKFNIHEIIDENNFIFECNIFPNKSINGGGNDIYISSLNHGFSSVQTNTKNDILNHSISLEGENYAFLCSPQLGNLKNTGNVNDIFARISLDQSPGSMVFNFLSNPKIYETPLFRLSDLEFIIKNYNNTLYEFFLVNFSFVIEITEIIDTTENFNISSRRGVNVFNQ